MKARRAAQRCKKSATRTQAHPFSNCGPIIEVLETTRRTLGGVEYEFVKLVAHLPQPNGLWDQAHLTVRLSDDATLAEAITEILALHVCGQLAAMAKEVHHA